jgi:hypothetical protein
VEEKLKKYESKTPLKLQENHPSLRGSKLVASLLGFAGNFALRKWLVFPERRMK